MRPRTLVEKASFWAKGGDIDWHAANSRDDPDRPKETRFHHHQDPS